MEVVIRRISNRPHPLLLDPNRTKLTLAVRGDIASTSIRDTSRQRRDDSNYQEIVCFTLPGC